MGAGHEDEREVGAEPESFIDRLRRESATSAAATADGLSETIPGSGETPAPGAAASPDAPDAPDADAGVVSVSGAAEPGRRMPPEARRALVSLMRQGVVLAARKARVFEALVRHEAAVRAHLAELYLELVLDEPAGVAFVGNRPEGAPDAEGEVEDDGADDDEGEGGDGATLIARRTLSLYDTLLLLVLRKHYQERQGAGEQRIVIDLERIESALVAFLPLTASERGDRRQLNAALKRMVEKRLLTRVRGDDERFEITPVIRYVVDAAFLDALLGEYERLAGGSDGAVVDPATESTPESAAEPSREAGSHVADAP